MRSIGTWLLVTVLALAVLGLKLAAPDAAPSTLTTALDQSAASVPSALLRTSLPGSSALASPGQNKALQAEWQSNPPVIDGDLSDWEHLPRMVLDRDTASYPPPANRPHPDNLSAWAAIVWDTQKLYVAFSVTDDVVVRDSRYWYDDDMIGFSFDVDRDGAFSLGDLLITVSPDGLVTTNGGYALGVESVVGRHDRGWHGEFSIPLFQFGSDFLTDAEVGFTWGVLDDDGQGVRNRLVWEGVTFSAPTPGQGSMHFVNGPSREWMSFTPGVDGFDGLVDATLNSWPGNENSNFGASPVNAIRGNEQWHLAMKVTPPVLPPGARALEARLHMTLVERANNPNNSNSTRARIYRLLRPWDETAATWFNATSTTRWAIGGANAIGQDRAGQVIAEAQLRPNERSYTWDISALIGDWYQNPAAHHGFLFRGEAGGNVLYDFYSSRCSRQQDPACAPPRLEILVELPPPANQ